jgi:ABC-2 type transport system permease protein
MTATLALWQKHMTKFWRHSEEAVGTLLSPVLWVLLFGAGMGAVMAEGAAGIEDYTEFVAPGIISLTALTGAVVGGATLLDERLRGIMKEYLVAPIPRISIIMGNMLSSVTKATLQSVVILVVAALAGAGLTQNPLEVVLALVLMATYSLGFVGLATAWAVRASSTGGYHALIFLFNLPLLFASNALYPLELLPGWLETLARLNPTTYVIDSLRHVLYGTDPVMAPALSAAVVVGFAALGTAVGYWSFQRATAT